MHRRSLARGKKGLEEEEEEVVEEDARQPPTDMTVENKVAAAERPLSKKDFLDDKELGAIEEQGAAACCGPESSILWVVLKLGVCALAGIIFGLVLEKGRVYEPSAIRHQMVFEQWTMLKMFFSAMGVGQFCLAVLSVIPHFRPVFTACCLAYSFSQEESGILRAVIGPFILGCGMSIAGSCPGMTLAQVGSDTKNAIFTISGALCGALMFGLVGDFVTKLLRPKKKTHFLNVQDTTGVFYAWIAFPMSVIIISAAVLVEWLVPWQDDLPESSRNPVNGTANIFMMKAWMPSVAGSIIGCLQVAIAFAVKDTLGGSSAYMTIMSQLIFPKKLQSLLPNFAKFRCGIGNWWQVFFVAFAMLGAFLSSLASNSTSSTPGVSIPAAFVGGFLMLFGARIGSGCTSGHGLSGVALLYWWSLLAIPAMFAGGIATAFALRGFGILDQFVCPPGIVCPGTT